MPMQEIDRQPNLELHELLLRVRDLDSAIETGLGTCSTTDDFIAYLEALSLGAIDAQVRDRIVVKLQALIDAGFLTDANITAAAAELSGARLTYLLALQEANDSTLADDLYATLLPGE